MKYTENRIKNFISKSEANSLITLINTLKTDA